MRMIDITGQIFGKITVLEYAYYKNKRTYWKCICECGNTKILSRHNLVNGHTKSCGCLQKSYHLLAEEGMSGLHQLIKAYEHNAKIRNLEWNLTEEQVKYITKLPCFFCGKPPERISKTGSSSTHGDYKYNGIDRVDNSKGYFLENCVPCCYTCNARKKNFSVEDMIKCLEFLGYTVRLDDRM